MTARERTERQPRERAVACFPCGLNSRNQPRTTTWNFSGLCDRHEAARLRQDAIDALMDDGKGYSRQIAEQIVDRTSGVPAQRVSS